ncbi:hypothetical protein [Ammoniphilus sp. YIM 78166]|uniref:hypothetical protein n=1 Tax=Ammoniphilus sp. YIM 78166 TaxID=1644106 RepID=UPI00106F8F62|nr:hypothetical protein [Ammoniphilus sp. YIM 78166]
MKLTMVNGKEAFMQCEYPYYKELEVHDSQMGCILYSAHSASQTEVRLPLINFESTVHQLSIALIRLQSQELWAQQQEILEKAL